MTHGTNYKALIDSESPGTTTTTSTTSTTTSTTTTTTTTTTNLESPASELWVGEFADCAGSGVRGVRKSGVCVSPLPFLLHSWLASYYV